AVNTGRIDVVGIVTAGTNLRLSAPAGIGEGANGSIQTDLDVQSSAGLVALDSANMIPNVAGSIAQTLSLSNKRALTIDRVAGDGALVVAGTGTSTISADSLAQNVAITMHGNLLVN